MSRPSCKERILDAAEAVALDGGAARLTLDAVAKRAEVSKGGVLYHFPSKEALFVGMVARHIEHALALRESFGKKQKGTGRNIKADILATLTRKPEDNQVSAALLAAVANEPKLLGPALTFHRERFRQLAGSDANEDFARKAVLPLAADGLFFLELLQVSPFSPKQREAIVTTLLKLAKEVGVTEPGDAQDA